MPCDFFKAWLAASPLKGYKERLARAASRLQSDDDAKFSRARRENGEAHKAERLHAKGLLFGHPSLHAAHRD